MDKILKSLMNEKTIVDVMRNSATLKENGWEYSEKADRVNLPCWHHRTMCLVRFRKEAIKMTLAMLQETHED